MTDVLLSQAFSKLFQDGVVAGCFVFLLYYFVKRNNQLLETISSNLERFGTTLENVSHTLLRIDTRVSALEAKIEEMEANQA